MKLVTAEEMRSLDNAAIDTFHVPSLELMENAGRCTVDVMLDRYGDPLGKTVTIFVGPGNNGGDGLVIARLLATRLARPVVFLLVSATKLKGDSAKNYSRLLEVPCKIIQVADEKDLQDAAKIVADSWTVVDSIFGTGLTRQVSGTYGEAIRIINEAQCPVISVDIASGLNSDNGEPLGTCVQADTTVSFGQAKIGQVVHPGGPEVHPDGCGRHLPGSRGRAYRRGLGAQPLHAFSQRAGEPIGPGPDRAPVRRLRAPADGRRGLHSSLTITRACSTVQDCATAA